LFFSCGKKQVSIEIHPCQLSQSTSEERQWMRMLQIARSQGCTFHFGSDAHSIDGLNCHEKLVYLAKACGISKQDITSFT